MYILPIFFYGFFDKDKKVCYNDFKQSVKSAKFACRRAKSFASELYNCFSKKLGA